MATWFIKLENLSYSLWAPPLTLDTVSPQEVYVTHHQLSHRPSGERNEDQPVEFHLRAECSLFFVLSCSLVSFLCLSLGPASHSDLDTKPTRPDPEGESSPPKSDSIAKMESPAKKGVDRRLMTPTKTDAIPRSPGSPASPAPRSKRKEGKGKWFICRL